MRFKYQGTQYLIEFERYYPVVTKWVDGKEDVGISTKPSTIARLVTFDPDNPDVKARKKTFLMGTAHCNHKDKFTLEGGRVAALRALSNHLTDPVLRKAMWSAYQNRFTGRKPAPMSAAELIEYLGSLDPKTRVAYRVL